MRLSEWRSKPPVRDAVASKVMAVVEPVLAALGAAPDPHCWVAWGDDPGIRWTILVPTGAGLVTVYVRVHVPQEGPRATAKLTRWGRVSVGDLGVDTQSGHRLLSFQVEQTVLRGVDAEADLVAAFALLVLAAIDGRPLPDLDRAGPRRPAGPKTAARVAGTGAAAKTAPAKTLPAKTLPAKTLPAKARPPAPRPSDPS